MPKPELAKNSRIVRLPKQTSSVRSAFEKAMRKAKEQKWSKVVIVGTGPHGGHFYQSKMPDEVVIGILDGVKHIINTDRFG